MRTALLLFTLILACSCDREADLYRTSKAFDLEALLRLETYGNIHTGSVFTKPYLILVYITQLTCESCKIRELRELRDVYARHKGGIDFALVSHGQSSRDFRLLRKVGYIPYPIFKEAVQGELGLHSAAFSIMVIDLQRGEICLEYLLTPDTDGQLAVFEENFKKNISESDGSS